MKKKNYLATFAKSFNWAGFFLPKNIYNDCTRLYAFCRVLDDIVDEKTDLEIRKEKFNEINNIYKNTYELNNKKSKYLGEKEYEIVVGEIIDLADNNNIKAATIIQENIPIYIDIPITI